MMRNNIHLHIVSFFCCFVFFGCNKLLEIPESTNQIETNQVFSDSTKTSSALLGVYHTLGASGSIHNSFVKSLSLYSDELNHNTGDPSIEEFRQSNLTAENNTNKVLWANLYSIVYQCNSIIENVEKSQSLTSVSKNIFLGEAKFLRAFANFNLVNIYSNVPLILTTDVNQNRVARQVESKLVYEQIILDLLDAKTKLSSKSTGLDKSRVNRISALALLARTYLYVGRWDEAEKTASEVISSTGLISLPPLEKVFLANSDEAIFQLWKENGFVSDVTSLIPLTSTSLPNYPITTELLNSFESGDGRKAIWMIKTEVNDGNADIGYYAPGKYRNRVASTVSSEYAMVLRVGEQYLIRAEAAAQLGKLSSAVNDLNIIRARATGIAALEIPNSKEQCLELVMLERQKELFNEWGHRFFDLKRTGKLDAILGKIKSNWKSTANSLPIPLSEITYNFNLKQNDGY